jgi:hypothetical protein
MERFYGEFIVSIAARCGKDLFTVGRRQIVMKKHVAEQLAQGIVDRFNDVAVEIDGQMVTIIYRGHRRSINVPLGPKITRLLCCKTTVRTLYSLLLAEFRKRNGDDISAGFLSVHIQKTFIEAETPYLTPQEKIVIRREQQYTFFRQFESFLDEHAFND